MHCRRVQHGLVAYPAGAVILKPARSERQHYGNRIRHGTLAKLFPFLIGFLADPFGLQTAIWILILGPLALLIGLPQKANQSPVSTP